MMPSKPSQDRERQKNEGQAYANDVVPRARGMASRLLQEADGYNGRVSCRSAEGDASRFQQILVEYAKAPASRAQRLYLDMMQSVVGNSSKVLIDQKAGNSLLYLPLDQLLKQSRRRGSGAGRRRQPPRPVAAPPEASVHARRRAARANCRATATGETDDEVSRCRLLRCSSRPCWCCRSRSTRSIRNSTRSSSSWANSSMPRPKRASTSRYR